MGIFDFFKGNKKVSSLENNVSYNTNVPNSVEIIDNHLNQFFSKKEDIVVLDEIESEIIHRDVYIIKANNDSYGHTYMYDENKEYAKGVGFNSVVLVNSMELSSEFTEIELTNNKVVDIYTLVPLYKEELKFKKENSLTELLEKFDDFNIEEIVQIGRKNVCL